MVVCSNLPVLASEKFVFQFFSSKFYIFYKFLVTIGLKQSQPELFGRKSNIGILRSCLTFQFIGPFLRFFLPTPCGTKQFHKYEMFKPLFCAKKCSCPVVTIIHKKNHAPLNLCRKKVSAPYPPLRHTT